jgi:hypothetical protein
VLTAKMIDTIVWLEASVSKDGGLLSADPRDVDACGTIIVEAQYGSDFDRERVTWTLIPSGALILW